ncbi:MAG: ABC transporter permease subunit/CPBP intramembrane protease [Myxococcota bacterium]|jgi:sodium transport system permease protein|nr:ABC transporter permease subunit/CPBP intramembrane protease [Myxococcota bacterium]
MLRQHIIVVIARKELVESLRDRRTLFMMVVMPILLYAVLFSIVFEFASARKQKLESKRSVVAIEAARGDEGLLEALRAEPTLELRFEAAGALGEDEGPELIVDFSSWGEDSAEGTHQLELRFVSIEDESKLARDRVEKVLRRWQEQELERRMSARGLPSSYWRPLEWTSKDDSDSSQRGGAILAALVPLLVVTTVLSGALYPAIDLTAGEKERGSIQTLFTAPISVLEIVFGKYIAVCAIALLSGTANVLSMALLFSVSSLGPSAGVDLSFSIQTIVGLVVCILMIAFLVSAVVLGAAIMARNFKDAQNILTPLMFVFIIPGMIAQFPGVEMDPALALIPALNVTLLMKELFKQGLVIEHLFLVAASSLGYTALALVVAAQVFSQERVIVGERASLGLFLQRDAKPRLRPSVSEGLAWWVFAFVLLFYVGANLQRWNPQWGLLATLWGVLLVPTLLLTKVQKLNWRETFSLRRAGARGWLAALLLGLSAWSVVALVERALRQVLPMPELFVEQMSQFFPQPQGALDALWLLFLLALTPAVCEELLFRGYLFSSLRGRVPNWLLVVGTGLLFGVFHLSIYRILGTSLLGVLMALLVLRGGSIGLSMLFHFLNNGVALLLAFVLMPAEIPIWVSLLGGAVVALALVLLYSAPTPSTGAKAAPG